MAASFDSPGSSSFDSQSAMAVLPCIVMLSPGGSTRTRLEAVLRRPGLLPIFCDDALSAMGEVAKAAAGKGPASCVLLLDQPAMLHGLDDFFDAAPKFFELPIVWIFEPGPPVSLKDTPWDDVRAMLRRGKVEPALGRPTREDAASPALVPALAPALAVAEQKKPTANEWVASSSETWAMPGLPAGGAKGSTRVIEPSLRLTGEPLPPPAPKAANPVANQVANPAASPVVKPAASSGGFDAPDALADATPQPKSAWLLSSSGREGGAGSGAVLSDDELAMLLGPDGERSGTNDDTDTTNGFARPRS